MRGMTWKRGAWGRGGIAAVAVALVCALAAVGSALAAFGPGGRERLRIGPSHVDRMLNYPGGKLLLFGPYAGRGGQIARLRANGAIDTSFGEGGRIAIAVKDAWVQRDGRILVVASAPVPGSTSGETDAALTRLLPSGKPDPSFGKGGTVLVDLGRRIDGGSAVGVTGSGMILVGGTSATRVESRGPGDGVAVVARLRPDGSLDPAFSGDGRAVLPTGGVVVDLANGPRGSVVAATSDSPGLELFRLGPGGGLDPDFGERGRVDVVVTADEDSFSPVEQVATLPGGRIVVAGTLATSRAHGTHYSGLVARYRADGRRDRSFGKGGVARAGFPRGLFFGDAFAALRDGRVVLGGETFVPKASKADFAALCFGPSGKLARGCGHGGRFRVDFGGWDMVRSLAIQPPGQLVLAGSTGEHGSRPTAKPTALARLPLGRHPVR